jgi:hypothetical protein
VGEVNAEVGTRNDEVEAVCLSFIAATFGVHCSSFIVAAFRVHASAFIVAFLLPDEIDGDACEHE